MASRAFLARVYAFRFLDGFVLIYPLYTVMFAARGLSPSQVAATLMAWSVTGFLLQIPMGALADRFSRRWLLCLGQVLRGVGFVVWMLQPDFGGFLVGMVLWGVKSALTNGTFEALVYDELHAIAGKFVGNRYTLLRVGRVVTVTNGNFLAEESARCVDICGRLIDAIFHLSAGRSAWAGNWPTNAEFDLS